MAAFLLTAMSVTSAQAGGTEEHRALMVAGQLLRSDGKLLRARDLFDDCAKQGCEAQADAECASIRAFCSERVTDLVHDIPMVSVRATDDLGAPLPGASAWVDGTRENNDHSIAVDPGTHLLRVDYLGQTTATSFEVAKGERKEVRATLDLRRRVASRPVPLGVWGLGGLSAVALATFGTFGVLTLNQASDLSGCKPTCDASRRAAFEVKTYGADISLGIAILAAAGAAVVYLVRPRVERIERLSLPTASSR